LSQLAQAADVSKGYLWKLEDGKTDVRPSGNTLYKISRALGTSMSALMGREVLVDDPAQIPASLKRFARDEGLRERDVAMLAQVNFRGRQPERPEDWAFIWHAIKRSVPDRSSSTPQ
jgi:transcriptional regulator with XRE-family HTH domain